MADSESADQLYGELRQLSHEQAYQLWQDAKHGTEFEGEQGRLVQAMREHPEYYRVWDRLNEFGQSQVVVDGVDPFLRVTLHSVVENQAAAGTPPEVQQILASRASHRRPRHQVVHEIANTFVEFLCQVLQAHQMFDNEAYRKKLQLLLPPSRRRGR